MKEIENALHAGVCLVLSSDEDTGLREEFNSMLIEQKLNNDGFHRRWSEMMNEKYANFPKIQLDTIENVVENEQNSEKGDWKMSKHTPGTWLVEKDGEFFNVVCEQRGFNRYVVGTEGLYRPDGCDEANARLIAAAPELLEALNTLLCLHENDVWTDDAWKTSFDKARAAITKATGGEK